jgi:hypothetical protein
VCSLGRTAAAAAAIRSAAHAVEHGCGNNAPAAVPGIEPQFARQRIAPRGSQSAGQPLEISSSLRLTIPRSSPATHDTRTAMPKDLQSSLTCESLIRS